MAERQEAWLFDQCHDDAYRLRDVALSLLLCRCHVFSGDRVADLFQAPVATTASAAALPAAGVRVRLCGLVARPELNGREGIILGPSDTAGSASVGAVERWDVRLVDAPTGSEAAVIRVRPASFELVG